MGGIIGVRRGYVFVRVEREGENVDAGVRAERGGVWVDSVV